MIIHYTGKQKYDVVIEHNILDNIEKYYSFKDEKKLIVCDSLIPDCYLNKITSKLTNTFIYRFKSGEESKNINTILDILDFLVTNKFSRTDMIISLGGGVTSDISGFVASIFKRGIKLVLIPTSTLGMVDAAIGSKNGVDYKGIKNVFGTFFFPKVVLCDLETLKTLPRRHYYNGLVEALKIALLVDKRLYHLFLNGNLDEHIDEIIYLSILNKVNIVKKDEIDSSLRMILNFGHTIGHAIEAINMGNILHGEAVAKGMLYMIEDNKLLNEVKNILKKMHIDTSLNDDNEKIREYVLQDKKIRNGQINLIKLHSLTDFYVKKIKAGDFDVRYL